MADIVSPFLLQRGREREVFGGGERFAAQLDQRGGEQLGVAFAEQEPRDRPARPIRRRVVGALRLWSGVGHARRRPRERDQVFASRTFRSLFSRQNEQSSISGFAGRPCDHDGCIAQRAS